MFHRLAPQDLMTFSLLLQAGYGYLPGRSVTAVLFTDHTYVSFPKRWFSGMQSVFCTFGIESPSPAQLVESVPKESS
jgi:hypothetical protein